MTSRKPAPKRAQWGVVLAVTAAHPVLILLLYPFTGEAINIIVLAAPVIATLLLGIRVGAVFGAINAFVSGLVFTGLTGMQFREGLPKALVTILVMMAVCWGADRLRHFIAQRKSIEAALQHAQKMEAIGRLAGGVAHDINNTLNAIMGSTFALRHELAALGHSFPDLDNIAVACDRGAQLTRNLLGFARKHCTQEETFSLNSAVKTVQALLSRAIRGKLRFEIHLAEDHPLMIGDQRQLEHAIMNLCLNAIDAMGDEGTLTISTSASDIRVSLNVSDTGSGMDDNVREHAFEPFFTTKPLGKGTGMGLSVVYGTVTAMHGEIALDTRLGSGTSITLTFPKAVTQLSHDGPILPSLSDTDALTFLAGLTILLVDDEPLVLRAGMRMLQSMGCKVVCARNGREAVDAFKARRETIALAVIDLVMPDADGAEVLEDILALAPRAPVILATGHALEPSKLEALLRGRTNVSVLPKPYEAQQFIVAARRLLPTDDASSSRTGTG
jgi:two-component system, cell cycle sensor histidine kinase and response regulator CckA